MHFCIAIITKEFPTDDVLHTKLAPYYEEDYYNSEDYAEKPRPVLLWDFWILGGRYGAKLKLNAKPKSDDEDDEYRWGFYDDQRSGRVFRSEFLERCSKNIPGFFHEEAYYKYCGFREGYLLVDGCRIKDALNFDEIATDNFGFIGKDDEVYVRSYWDGEKWIEVPDEEYETKVKSSLKDVDGDCYITFVDIHD